MIASKTVEQLRADARLDEMAFVKQRIHGDSIPLPGSVMRPIGVSESCDPLRLACRRLVSTDLAACEPRLVALVPSIVLCEARRHVCLAI